MTDKNTAKPRPLNAQKQREIRLEEANVELTEETRALRRQLIEAGLDPCV